MPDSRTLSTLALVASFRAAVAAARAVAERRAGRDPSEEQPAAEARAGLDAAAGRLRAGLVRLRVRLAVGAPDERTAALVQAFEDRVLAADLALDLHRAHQQLMSLYPAVSAEPIEAARLARQAADRLAGADDFEGGAALLVEALEGLLGELPEGAA